MSQSILLQISPNFIRSRLFTILLIIYLCITNIYIYSSEIHYSGREFIIHFLIISFVNIFIILLILYPIYFTYKHRILTIDEEKIHYQKGRFSLISSEIRHIDVKNIQIFQGPIQKIMGVGSIYISSTGQDEASLTIKGIEYFNEVRDLINEKRTKLETPN